MAVKKKPAKAKKAKKAKKATTRGAKVALRKIDIDLATTKVALAKRLVGSARWVSPVINMKPKTAPSQFSITARMVEAAEGLYCPRTFLARVPVMLTTIPEVPEVVMLEGKFFTLTTTVPMTYTQRQYAEATRI
jgi:hypothetical protein